MAKSSVPSQVGDIFRLKLPDGRFAFGCVLKDASVGFYNGTYASPEFDKRLKTWTFAFVVAIYSDILPSGVCELVDHKDFESEDDRWPPPKAHFDLRAKQANIYYKGRFTKCRPEDVVGLEHMQVYELDHVIERIMETQPEVDTLP
jgi:hypothetical protein